MPKINHSATHHDAQQFFDRKCTPEMICDFFSQGFPHILLKENHFIYFLKKKAIEDESDALQIINEASDFLPEIVNHATFYQMLYSLNDTVLFHLFSKAPFIQERFLKSLPQFLRWMRDERYSNDRRLFIAQYFQTHFFRVLENHLTVGTLQALLSVLIEHSEKNTAFVSSIMQHIQVPTIQLFSQSDNKIQLLVFSSTISKTAFTFLMQHIPDCFFLLFKIKVHSKWFAPLLVFENIPHELRIAFQKQLIVDAIHQFHTQPCMNHDFFKLRVHFNEMDRQFIETARSILHKAEYTDSEKINAIIEEIKKHAAHLSAPMQTLLSDRALLTQHTEEHPAASSLAM